jgi:hypothetical protein
MAEQRTKRRFTAVAVEPPALNNHQWAAAAVVGAVLLAMALAQILSIREFQDNFALQDMPATPVLAVLLILAELWAAAGFFQIRLSPLFRRASNGLALLVGLFWLTWILYLLSSLFKYSANFFGGFLHQQPGFWPVFEAIALLLLMVYVLDRMSSRSAADLPVVTRVNKRDLKRRKT